jgi:NADH dehydrogenase
MILVTGGTGVMGRRLVDTLVKKGHTVRVLALPGDPEASGLEHLPVDVFYGDITERHTLSGVMDHVDIVVHLAAVILSPCNPAIFHEVNYKGTENLISLCRGSSVNHFIYISSASVVYPQSNPYSRSKQNAEQMVKESRLPHYTIVRPTLAYEDGGAEEFWKFVQYLKSFPVVPFIGTGRALKSPVYVDDIISGLVKIPGNPVCFGKMYNFSGGEALTIMEMTKRLLRHMGKEKIIIPIPVALCILLAKLWAPLARLGNHRTTFTWQTITGMVQDAALDNHSAVKDIKYNPRPFSEGIKELRSIKDCLKN